MRHWSSLTYKNASLKQLRPDNSLSFLETLRQKKFWQCYTSMLDCCLLVVSWGESVNVPIGSLTCRIWKSAALISLVCLGIWACTLSCGYCLLCHNVPQGARNGCVWIGAAVLSQPRYFCYFLYQNSYQSQRVRRLKSIHTPEAA